MNKEGFATAAKAIGVAVLEGARQAAADRDDDFAQRVSEEERSHAITCAAAALVDAKVADLKIVELLKKYFRIDDHAAAAALGEGRIMVTRKMEQARKSEKARKTSKNK